MPNLLCVLLKTNAFKRLFNLELGENDYLFILNGEVIIMKYKDKDSYDTINSIDNIKINLNNVSPILIFNETITINTYLTSYFKAFSKKTIGLVIDTDYTNINFIKEIKKNYTGDTIEFKYTFDNTPPTIGISVDGTTSEIYNSGLIERPIAVNNNLATYSSSESILWFVLTAVSVIVGGILIYFIKKYRIGIFFISLIILVISLVLNPMIADGISKKNFSGTISDIQKIIDFYNSDPHFNPKDYVKSYMALGSPSILTTIN